ncbi:MAG: acyl-CoA thioesterase II [Rothia dentocariosa]|nr:acyl-CoA thioesterase II [Rothia dentocariosa]
MTKPTPTQNLMTMLNLTPTEPVGGDEAFSAVTLTRESPRTYGGQVLAQAIMAANSTVTNKVLHSIHAYFLRPGDITKELIFTSQRLNDGRSFATRRVQALQDDIPIFSAIASFQAPGRGPEHTAVTMPQAPDPEGLPSVSDYIGEVPHPIAQAVAWERPIDIRYVSPHLYTAPDSSSQEPVATVWFKTFDTLVDATGAPASEAAHQAAIAYASDYLPLEPALRAHGKFWLEPGMKSASLDHAMWFHRAAPADEWLLYVMDSPTAQGGRMLARGSIFTRDGELVATIAQEMMFRLPEYK